jgi:oxygen-dependent protoporphyrinogen oxidase
VFVGRAGQEHQIDWSQEGLLNIARKELKTTLGISAEPSFWRVNYWKKAMPQYNIGHTSRLARIDKGLRNFPNLALAGNGYQGIGIPDCINSAKIAVEKVLQQAQISK